MTIPKRTDPCLTLWILIGLLLLSGGCGYDDQCCPATKATEPVRIEYPPEGAAFIAGQPLLLSGAVEASWEADTYEWKSDQDGLLGNSSEISPHDLSEGVHQISFNAYSNVQLIGTATIQITIFNETESEQPPNTVIIGSPPSAFTGNHNVVFEWEGDDTDGEVVSYRYRLDGPITTASWVATVNTLSDSICINESGEYTFTVTAIDDQGLEDPTPARYMFRSSACSS